MRLITSRPHRLLNHIVEEIRLREQRGENSMLIVPSQNTLQAETEIMSRLNLRGSFSIDILSPSRLQGRVFERAGQPQQVVLDERGKHMVLTEVLEDYKESLTVYRSSASGSADGFIKRLAALIADIKRSRVDAASFREGVNKLDPGGAAYKKLADAALLFEAYESRLSGKLADGEDVARIKRAKLGESGVLDGKHVYVMGFDMITESFARDLIAMDACCASLTIAVESDKNSAPDGRLFAPVNASLDRLRKIAHEEGSSFSQEHLNAPLGAPEDIELLESSLFALNARPVDIAPAHIHLHAASSMRSEVHHAASKIRGLLMSGVSSSDIAVVYPKGSGYAPLLSGILPMYGITSYIAEKRPAHAHPLCRFVLSSLKAVSSSFSTQDVVECIRSGFLPIAQDEADALVLYAEGVDIRSDRWLRPFSYQKESQSYSLDMLNAAREAAIKPLLHLRSSLSAAQNADDTLHAILDLLDETEAFERLADMRLALMEAGMDAHAQDCAQVWNALMDTLDQLHTLLGGSTLPAKVVAGLLSSGLSALELSALPPAEGAIICGEIGNVRTGGAGILFAIGMNDEQGMGENGLLTAYERDEAASSTGVYLGMSASERAALAQLDTLKTVSSAKKLLFASYALSDETGRALREGSAVSALRRLFPALEETGSLPEDELLDMLNAPDSALEALAVHLSRVSDGKEELLLPFESAYAALNEDLSRQSTLYGITRALCDAPVRRIDATTARAMYGRPVMSVSRLELFAQCPYSHFVRYGLVPQQELTPGVDRAELGTLYHEAAERFTRAVIALPDFPKISESACDSIMDDTISPLIEAWRNSPLGESARGGSIAERIRSTARRAGRNILSQFSSSRFHPMRFEFTFGFDHSAPIILELADGSHVYLQGKIDRIDVLEGDQKSIRIVDYKSGSKRFDPTMAYWGIQLQLLIYLSAALSRIPGADPAGFFYCRIADPTIKTESRIKEEVERQIAKKLALAGISLSDVEILRAQDVHHQQMITKDGKPSGRYAASMIDEDGMRSLVAFAKRRASQLAGAAYEGAIDDAPGTLGTYSACSLCSYAAICGFDPSRKKKRLLKQKKLDDLISPV